MNRSKCSQIRPFPSNLNEFLFCGYCFDWNTIPNPARCCVWNNRNVLNIRQGPYCQLRISNNKCLRITLCFWGNIRFVVRLIVALSNLSLLFPVVPDVCFLLLAIRNQNSWRWSQNVIYGCILNVHFLPRHTSPSALCSFSPSLTCSICCSGMISREEIQIWLDCIDVFDGGGTRHDRLILFIEKGWCWILPTHWFTTIAIQPLKHYLIPI